MSDDDDESLKIQFLLNFSNYRCKYLPEKLKSHLTNVCLTTAERCQQKLPITLRDNQFVCQYCLTQFNASNSRSKISPKIKPGPAMRRILSKVKRNKKLSPVEKKLAMRVHSGNRLVIKCLICNGKTVKNINKPSRKEAEDLTIETPPPTLPTKKKKKKKRNKPILNLPSMLLTPETIDISGPENETLNNVEDFVPLVASTPFPMRERPTLNPLSLKKKPVKNLTNTKKRNSLKMLLAEENKMTQRRSTSFKDFARNCSK